jgi:hypothetical protein
MDLLPLNLINLFDQYADEPSVTFLGMYKNTKLTVKELMQTN